MNGIVTGIGIIEKFIDIGKELAKLPALVLPQYQPAAADLYEISQKILKANENVSRWMYRFLYFDFQSQNAISEFRSTAQEYKTMKSGPEFQQLKYSCGDIGNIYYRNISSKIGNWFNHRKKEEVEGIFESLTDADKSMVEFVYTEIIGGLDQFIEKVEPEVDAGNLDEAEKHRLGFKRESKDIVQHLEKFSGDLSDLVIDFANIARVPITLGG